MYREISEESQGLSSQEKGGNRTSELFWHWFRTTPILLFSQNSHGGGVSIFPFFPSPPHLFLTQTDDGQRQGRNVVCVLCPPKKCHPLGQRVVLRHWAPLSSFGRLLSALPTCGSQKKKEQISGRGTFLTSSWEEPRGPDTCVTMSVSHVKKRKGKGETMQEKKSWPDRNEETNLRANISFSSNAAHLFS